MVKIKIISNKGIPKHYRLLNVVAKKVMSENGEIIGKVRDLAFDMRRVVGIYITGPLGLKKILIGMEYIDQIHADSVVLKINPITSLEGKIVFDKDGKKVGKVISVVRKGTANDFSELIVKKNQFSRGIHIKKGDMNVISKNIILKKVL